MKFEDAFFSEKDRLAIGVEKETGKHYLSIPVTNSFVDYEEYYEISEEVFNDYAQNLDKAIAFAEECRARIHDNLLIIKPGADRGISV